jgi:hypothetical protein
MGMDLCQPQLPLQQLGEQQMIAVMAVADMWMGEMVCFMSFASLIPLEYQECESLDVW